MTETNIEKCIAFINKNAEAKKVTSRVRFVMPDKLVAAVLKNIEANEGAFSVSIADFNTSLGWSPKCVRADYLKGKINDSHLIPEGKYIHVGTADKNTYYNFELVDLPEDEPEEPEEPESKDVNEGD